MSITGRLIPNEKTMNMLKRYPSDLSSEFFNRAIPAISENEAKTDMMHMIRTVFPKKPMSNTDQTDL